jgi:hypothetical protein
MSEHTPPSDPFDLSEHDIDMLARFAAIKDLDRFLTIAAHQWKTIKLKSANAVARALVMGADNGDAIEAMMILSYRASALAHLLDSIANEPALRTVLEHEPIKMAEVLARCHAEAKAAAMAATDAETPAP